MLSVAKTYVEWAGVNLPAKVVHGIEDPGVNGAAPVDLNAQAVSWQGPAHDHRNVFPELLQLLSHGRTISIRPGTHVPILDVLQDVPAIQRTLLTLSRRDGSFLPVDLDPVYENGRVWLWASFQRNDRDVEQSMAALRRDPRWKAFFVEVQRRTDDEILFESGKEYAAQRRWIERGLEQLANDCRRTVPLAAIVRPEDYWYFAQISANALPPAAAMYAAMFFLGSVTWYRPPLAFRHLIEGRHDRLVSEFLSVAPTQFVFLIASEMAGCRGTLARRSGFIAATARSPRTPLAPIARRRIVACPGSGCVRRRGPEKSR